MNFKLDFESFQPCFQLNEELKTPPSQRGKTVGCWLFDCSSIVCMSEPSVNMYVCVSVATKQVMILQTNDLKPMLGATSEPIHA